VFPVNFEEYFDKVYEEYDRYLIVPVALILASIAILGVSYVMDGEVVQRGLDFTGGTEVQYSINESFTSSEIQQIFADEGRNDVQVVRQTQGQETYLIVSVPPPTIEQAEAERILTENGYNVSVESLRSISASVIGEFFRQAMLAFVMAFMIMSLVIFYAFRDLTPSLAVVLAAAGDIIFAMAGMVVFGIPLTLGSLAALLMLIGYSVDTDIVLSTRVLKRKQDSLKNRIWSSVKTGVTMSSGGIAGFTLLYIISYLMVGSSELSNIAAVMVLGLVADMPLTWFGNAVILKKYVEEDWDFGKVIPWN